VTRQVAEYSQLSVLLHLLFNREVCKVYAKRPQSPPLHSITAVQECDPRYSSGQAQQTLIGDQKPATKNPIPPAYSFAFLTTIRMAAQTLQVYRSHNGFQAGQKM
jgi:hypothetical protein